MENASKALMIAGGILIGVLIISLGVYLFNNSSILSSSYSDKLSQDELNQLNNKFLIYAKDLTPQEMVSVINLVKENNVKNVDIEENQIEVIIDNKIINILNVSQDWKTVIMEQSDVNNEPKYKFMSVSYNKQNGRINKMIWKSIGGTIPIDEEIATTCYHLWSEWNYVDDTNHQRICKKCQQIQTQLHTWKNYIDNGSTHKKTCSICASTREEQHDYTPPYRDNENGTHSRNCKKCFNIETNLHDWENWKTINSQVHQRNCRLCSAKEQQNHIWEDWKTIQEGTCIIDEIQERTCQICNKKEIKDIKAPNEHLWKAATCTTPKTCTRCGVTQGNALGHLWKAATCTTPKTCTRCGATQGNALGHLWIRATCTKPQTCSRCNATLGKALGHSWRAATYTTPKTCIRCGLTEGNPLPAKVEQIILGNVTLSPSIRTATISRTIVPSYAANKDITWSSNNAGIASVDTNGVVTYNNAGITTIVARANDGSGVIGRSSVICNESNSYWGRLYNGACDGYRKYSSKIMEN